MLSDIPEQTDPRVLVDFRTHDDAGVYAWEGGPALVQTVDFFTPIVDDPFVYGEIAAANSLSDVYAMGGRPLTALAVAGFPEDLVDAETIGQVFRGGHATLAAAGVALLGGHTVRDREMKFGYAVTGAVDPRRIWRNAGARAGDVLLLTKAIGTGVVGTAIKFDRAPREVVDRAVAQMRTLNRAAAEALAELDVHACTDITGFGLIGHATEMARGSGVTIELDAAAVPFISGVEAMVSPNVSGGLKSNIAHFSHTTAGLDRVPDDVRLLLFDPQTSGGLLVAVADPLAAEAIARLRERGVPVAAIGNVRPPSGPAITIR